jgi:molybdenum cofactor biosynthesis enzyme MoaA
MAYSVGVGLTNECNLRCPHCYRSDAVINRLSSEIQRVCEAIPVKSMNLGSAKTVCIPTTKSFSITYPAKVL